MTENEHMFSFYSVQGKNRYLDTLKADEVNFLAVKIIFFFKNRSNFKSTRNVKFILIKETEIIQKKLK